MADGKEAARFFAERVANEAIAQDQGHVPVTREGFAAEASWYRDDEGTMHLYVEANGRDQELPLTLEKGSERQQIMQAIGQALEGMDRPAA